MGIPYYRYPITETDRLVCRVHTTRQTMAWEVLSITTISSRTARHITVRGRLPLHVLEMNMDYNVQYGIGAGCDPGVTASNGDIYYIFPSYCITRASQQEKQAS